jgi:thiamine-phosphate pyrophosphorylase
VTALPESARSLGRDAPPRLIVITDLTVAPEGELERRVERLLCIACAGTVMVQLRDKDLPVRSRLALGERLAAACRAYGHWFVVNDRVDLAVILGADGVHLGAGSVSPDDARRLLQPGAFVSQACHTAHEAALTDADAALLSPIFAPRKGRGSLGVAGIAAAVSVGSGTRPLVYALGGVDASNAAACVAAGAAGVAVVGAALDGRDPEPLLEALEILLRSEQTSGEGQGRPTRPTHPDAAASSRRR